MEKNFREVIRDIKYYEVWESDNFTIELDGKDIDIRHKDGFNNDCVGYTFSENEKFKLQRKSYTFTEAFKAYEEGEEIESCVSYERYSKVDDTDCYYNKFECDWYESINRIDMSEIRGKWFINN